jgi:hypothetical protein
LGISGSMRPGASPDVNRGRTRGPVRVPDSHDPRFTFIQVLAAPGRGTHETGPRRHPALAPDCRHTCPATVPGCASCRAAALQMWSGRTEMDSC